MSAKKTLEKRVQYAVYKTIGKTCEYEAYNVSVKEFIGIYSTKGEAFAAALINEMIQFKDDDYYGYYIAYKDGVLSRQFDRLDRYFVEIFRKGQNRMYQTEQFDDAYYNFSEDKEVYYQCLVVEVVDSFDVTGHLDNDPFNDPNNPGAFNPEFE